MLTPSQSGLAALILIAALAYSSVGLVTSRGVFSGRLPSPPYPAHLAAAAGLGGWIGAHYGSRRIPAQKLRWLLAAVLIVADLKLIFS